MITKKIISLLLSLIISLSFVLPAYAQSVVISNVTPANGDMIELVDNSNVEFSCEVSSGALIKFLLDGELFAEFKQSGRCTTLLNSNKLGLGKKEFQIIVLDSKGRLYSESVNFESYVPFKGEVNPGISTEVQNFNSMSESYAGQSKDNVDTSLFGTFSNDFGWTLTGENVFLKRLAGKSGMSGDYAVAIYPFNASGGNQTAQFKLDSWSQEVTTGIISLEYDWAVLPVQNGSSPAMYGIPVPGESDLLSSSSTKTVYNTNFIPTHGQWMNMRYEYNVDTNKISLWIDGTKYWDNVSAVKSASNNLSQFVFAPVFWSGCNYFTSLGAAYFVFDNFHLYKKEKLMLSELKYKVDNTSTVFSDGNIPYGSECITAEFTAPIGEMTNEDIELYVAGNKINHNGISVDGNKLTVNIPGEISDKDILIKTRSGLEQIGGVSVPGGIALKFHIGSKIESSYDVLINSSAASSNEALQVGDVVSAQYTAQNISNENQDILLVLTVRENGSLVSLSAKEITVLANDDDIFTLPPITIEENGDYEIELIAVGSFLNPETFN